VQGLVIKRLTAGPLSAAQVVPTLLRKLSDDYNRIRGDAALALAQRGEPVFDIAPDAVDILIQALDENTSRDWGDDAQGLDSDASVCGHASRLLAAASHRLTSEQRQSAVAAIDRAISRYADRQDEYVSFWGGGFGAFRLLQDQRKLVAEPTEWGLAELFREVAFVRPNCRLSPLDCDRRLADVYVRAPEETMAHAIAAVGATSDRAAAIGAAQWLMTLGPAAGEALNALDRMAEMAKGQRDVHAQEQASAASNYIRRSLLVMSAQDMARAEMVTMLRAHAQAGLSADDRDAHMTKLIGFLDHPDAHVRAAAAEGLAMLMSVQSAGAVSALERLLTDDVFTEVGIPGAYECGGRLCHWRRERRSPRAGAIAALLGVGRIPAGDATLKAMLAESMRPKAVCGRSAEAHRFAFAQWQQAVDAAGGLSVVNPLIHAAWQQVRNEPCAEHDGPHACAAELSEAIRRLSGRLI
jgi:hypothetical protein